MRIITVKYENNCRKCKQFIPAGNEAGYEKHVGIFCPSCTPTDTEEIRHYRQEAANQRADKYESWAKKREEKANGQLNSYPEVRHDWAFISQPGHIPLRERMNKADNRALESLEVATKFKEKAINLRKVRVSGDAEKRHQAKRDANDELIHVGSKIYDFCFGEGIVIRKNKKTYSIRFSSGYECTRDKSFVEAR